MLSSLLRLRSLPRHRALLLRRVLLTHSRPSRELRPKSYLRPVRISTNIGHRTDDKLNNKSLSSNGGKVGIFPGGPAVQFSSSQYTGANTLSLHPGAEDHQLALSGSKGLLELVDVINPTGEKIPPGQSMEWSTFVIDAQGNVNVKDGADIPTRRWVAYTNTDGSYGVGLYDGFTVPPPKKFSNVTLIAVKAQAGGE